MHPPVGPVADIDLAGRIHQDAVRQVEMSRFRLARLAPRGNQLTLGGKAMHPAVAVAVGDIQIPGRARRHFRRIVKGAGRARHQIPRLFTTGIGVDAPVANNLQGLAIQGELHRHLVGAVGDIDEVILNGDAVGVGNGANAPATQVVARPVKDHHRRVLPLEHINIVLGVGGDGADDAEGFPGRQLGPVLDQFVGIFAGADGGHRFFPLLGFERYRFRWIVRDGQVIRDQLGQNHLHHFPNVLQGFRLGIAPSSGPVLLQSRAVGYPPVLIRFDNYPENIGIHPLPAPQIVLM